MTRALENLNHTHKGGAGDPPTGIQTQPAPTSQIKLENWRLNK